MEGEGRWTLRELLAEYDVVLDPDYPVRCLNCEEYVLAGDLLVDEIGVVKPDEEGGMDISIIAACPRCNSTTGFDRVVDPSEDQKQP